jgi:hypothetical protein
MAVLTVNVIDRVTGLVAPAGAAAAAGGDSFANDGHTFLKVANGGGGGITVTVDSVQVCSHGFDHNQPDAAAVAAGAERWFGPFPTTRFGSSCAVTYSGVTTVTVAAVRLPTA